MDRSLNICREGERGERGGGGLSCGERIDFANLQLWFPQSVLSLVHSDEQKTGLGTRTSNLRHTLSKYGRKGSTIYADFSTTCSDTVLHTAAVHLCQHLLVQV